MTINHPKPPNKFGGLKLQAAPRPRQIYWCDYPEDAIEPEFWKKRPVVVISRNAHLKGPVTVLPITTSPQGKNVWAIHFELLLGNEKNSWVVCNQPVTFSTARLSQTGRKIKQMPQDTFDQALILLHKHLITPITNA